MSSDLMCEMSPEVSRTHRECQVVTLDRTGRGLNVFLFSPYSADSIFSSRQKPGVNSVFSISVQWPPSILSTVTQV